MVSHEEILASLVSIKLMMLGDSEPYHKLQKLIGRMKAEGISPPDGYVSIASVLAALPKLGEPISQDSFEYRERYERFVKDMEWVRARIKTLDTRRKLPHE